MTDSLKNATWAKVLIDMLDRRMLDVHTSLPGEIVSYDAAKQVADVRPMLKRRIPDPDGGDDTIEALPTIPAVPVVWPRGGGYCLTFPLAKGDGVMLVFSEADLSAWRDTGEASDPGDVERHGLAGAVAVPGVDTVARALTDASATHLVIGKDGGPAIHIDSTGVKIGAAGASHPIALGDKVDTWAAAVKAALAAAPGGPVTVPTLTSSSTKHMVDA